MPAQIAAHRFNRADSTRFENNAELVYRLIRKNNLTPVDLLMGLKYHMGNKFSWDEAMSTADEYCRNYDVAHNVPVEITIERYGEDD